MDPAAADPCDQGREAHGDQGQRQEAQEIFRHIWLNAGSAGRRAQAEERVLSLAATEGTLADASTNGGTTAFSTSVDTASITVSGVNDAPVLTPAAPSLTPITEDDLGNPGDPVSSLIAGSLTDVDSGDPQGIAITSLTPSNGTWEYSTCGVGP